MCDLTANGSQALSILISLWTLIKFLLSPCVKRIFGLYFDFFFKLNLLLWFFNVPSNCHKIHNKVLSWILLYEMIFVDGGRGSLCVHNFFCLIVVSHQNRLHFIFYMYMIFHIYHFCPLRPSRSQRTMILYGLKKILDVWSMDGYMSCRKNRFSQPCQVRLMWNLLETFGVGTGNSEHVLFWGIYYLFTFCEYKQTKHTSWEYLAVWSPSVPKLGGYL